MAVRYWFPSAVRVYWLSPFIGYQKFRFAIRVLTEGFRFLKGVPTRYWEGEALANALTVSDSLYVKRCVYLDLVFNRLLGWEGGSSCVVFGDRCSHRT